MLLVNWSQRLRRKLGGSHREGELEHRYSGLVQWGEWLEIRSGFYQWKESWTLYAGTLGQTQLSQWPQKHKYCLLTLCVVNDVFRLFGTIPSTLAVEWPTVPITIQNINIYASTAHRKYTITPFSYWCIAYYMPASKNKKDQKICCFVLYICVTEETTSLLVPTNQEWRVVTVAVPATTSCAVSLK